MQEMTMSNHARIGRRSALALGAGFLAGAGPSFAQAFPARPINIIGNLGGALDMPARVVFEKIRANTGATVVIEQRPGANGALGLSPVLRAPPNGYTLAYTFASALTLNPYMTKGLDFGPDSFTPISALVQVGPVIAAKADHPARTLRDLIEDARRRPEAIKIGYSGAGTHVNLLRLQESTGARFLLVPFRSNTDAITNTLGGFIDAHVDTVATVVAQAGKLKALSYGGHPRNPRLPDVPSMREIVPGLDMVTWFGMVAPPGLPADIANWLHAEIAKALRDPQVADALTRAGYDIVGTSPAELATLIREEAAAHKLIAEKYKLGG
jgi:tripartite-type tricarboxylate transporter receptor subunit TctC